MDIDLYGSDSDNTPDYVSQAPYISAHRHDRAPARGMRVRFCGSVAASRRAVLVQFVGSQTEGGNARPPLVRLDSWRQSR
jgi:hypothetical protein